MVTKLGAKKVAVFDAQEPYSQGLADTVEAYLKSKGVAVQRFSVTNNTTDFSAIASYALGIKSRIIIGYKGTADMNLAIQRGEADGRVVSEEAAALYGPGTGMRTFVTLARKGFFDGLSVHRVVPDFVIQSGDPRGDGEGGPGFTIRDELNGRPYLRGTVGMALDLWRDTGGSQFFITHSPQPHLDAKYTVFGRVIAGMDVVDQIQQGDIIRRVRVNDGRTTSRETN